MGLCPLKVISEKASGVSSFQQKSKAQVKCYSALDFFAVLTKMESMKNNVVIDAESQDVFNRCTFGPTSLKLPEGNLARPLYVKVNKVIELAGGKWDKKSKLHVFPGDPRETLGMAIDKGEIRDVKKETQAFYTPADLAARVVEYADVEGKSVLEPSAGHGALADACMKAGAARVTCCEIDEKSQVVLANKHYAVFGGDFLDFVAQEWGILSYDRVVMNPPFTKSQDIKHIVAAYKMLASNGILVAIMSPGFTYKQDKLSKAFKEIVTEHGEILEELEAGAFKESGTNVKTVIVMLRK